LVSFLYVYIGEKVPRYVIQNISRTRALFPEDRLILVTDKASLQGLDNSVKVLSPQDLDWHRNRPKLNKDLRFWDGWWQKTFDRLLMIRAVHNLFPSEALIQVETDVVLFPSFLGSGILEFNSLAFPMYSKTGGVASIIYSPNLSTSETFESHLLEELRKNQSTSDMDILGILSKVLEQNFSELKEFPNDDAFRFQHAWERDSFGFDGSSHGEWICGRDPKAHWGVGKRLQRTPISMNLEMGKYSLNENQLYLTLNGETFPIHNLHVHSKELVFFDPVCGVGVGNILDAVSDSSKSSLTFFVPKAFIFCLISNMKIWASSVLKLSAWKRLVGRLSSR
jgi:hypothetical protein